MCRRVSCLLRGHLCKHLRLSWHLRAPRDPKQQVQCAKCKLAHHHAMVKLPDGTLEVLLAVKRPIEATEAHVLAHLQAGGEV